ncbi:MAG: excinuclease ABC subunit UvrC [Pseudomonadota bacterium]
MRDHTTTQVLEEAPTLTGRALIEDTVKRLPGKPGVYRMIGERGAVLYVGKAKDLKKRVTSYAQARGHSNRILRMISDTRAMEFVVTQTEIEALLLEANLIKQLKPRYNVLLRDDKSFPHILIAHDHAAPQILKHRGARKRPGRYFGPFASAGAVNQTLNTLQKAFLLRSCSDSVYESRTRPCLLHQIKRCAAPCVDLITPAAYSGLVAEAESFLKGDNRAVQQGLSQQMEQAATDLDFERAAALRDRIRALSFVQASQDINASTLGDADVFAIHEENGQVCVQVFFFRAGQNWGNHAYFPRHDRDDPLADIMSTFIAQFYDNRDIPKLVLTNVEPSQLTLLTEALGLKANRRIAITCPQRGERRDIMQNAVMNAREALQRRQAESASQIKNLKALGQCLGLEEMPERVEVYDNSHIQGAHAVGGMIVAGVEGLQKNQYRKFTIKDSAITPGDDFGMMREVLRRRFSRLLKEADHNDSVVPDIIIIDGGKGQLSAAMEVFQELGLSSIGNSASPAIKTPLIVSIAKPKRENDRGVKTSDRTMGAVAEQIFLPHKPPFLIPPRDPALFFIQRLRDEAHRFAISAHRAKRKKAVSANPLDDVPGVGASRKRNLLNHFGSAKEIARAKPQDLAAVDGISAALAERIYDFFNA